MVLFQLTITRIITIYFAQGFACFFFLFLGLKILQRDRKRLNLIFSGLYFSAVAGFIINFIYGPITDENVVLVLNLMIGLITPPIGMSLFVTSKVGGVKLEDLCKTVIPFIIPLVLVLFLITYVPEFVTWLPRLVLQR